jgi:hypothetical protein
MLSASSSKLFIINRKEGEIMKISIKQGKKVNLRFQGKINMIQEVTLSKNSAEKLGRILIGKKPSSFEAK